MHRRRARLSTIAPAFACNDAPPTCDARVHLYYVSFLLHLFHEYLGRSLATPNMTRNDPRSGGLYPPRPMLFVHFYSLAVLVYICIIFACISSTTRIRTCVARTRTHNLNQSVSDPVIGCPSHPGRSRDVADGVAPLVEHRVRTRPLTFSYIRPWPSRTRTVVALIMTRLAINTLRGGSSRGLQLHPVQRQP